MILFNTFDLSFIFITFILFSFIACTLRLHFYFGPSFIDRLLVTDPRFVFILFLFGSLIFIYIFSALCVLFGLDFSVLPCYDLISNLADKDTINVNVGESATVNLNDGNVSVKVDHMSKVAAAVSAGAGASAGISVAKYVAGPPAVKIGAGVATAVAVQATTAIMSKVLDSNNSNNTTKLIANLIPSSTGGNVLNDYPLNLLTDMNSLLICTLVFLYIILNIYISKYIISKDIVKYIPTSLQNNKIGKLGVF